jgi:hypothetical protein
MTRPRRKKTPGAVALANSGRTPQQEQAMECPCFLVTIMMMLEETSLSPPPLHLAKLFQ